MLSFLIFHWLNIILDAVEIEFKLVDCNLCLFHSFMSSSHLIQCRFSMKFNKLFFLRWSHAFYSLLLFLLNTMKNLSLKFKDSVALNFIYSSWFFLSQLYSSLFFNSLMLNIHHLSFFFLASHSWIKWIVIKKFHEAVHQILYIDV